MAKMTIAPVSIWVQGQVKIAEVLEVTGIRDDYGRQTYWMRKEM